MPYTPPLEEIVTDAIATALSELGLGEPARVVSRDFSDNTVDVQVMTRRPVPTLDDAVEHEDLPIIPAVPVLWFRSGSGSITLPLNVGDTGLLLPLTYSASQWLDSGQVSDPGDLRHGHVANVVFLPGFCPKAQKPAAAALNALVVEAPDIRLGAGAAQFVALANLVNAELEKIEAALSTASAPMGGGAVIYGIPYAAGEVAATKVKAE